MAKFFQVAIVILVLALGFATAIENRRVRAQRLRRPAALRLPQRPIFARQEQAFRRPAALRLPQRPIFARQEEEPAEVTPYPAAADLKPTVSFEESAPEQVYGPPEQTYGPPEQTYGPPDAEPTTEELPAGEELPTADEPAEFAPNPDAEEFEPITSSRLTQARRPVNARRAKPARLQQQPKRQQKTLKSQRLTDEVSAVPVAPAVPFVFPGTLQSQQYYVINQQPFAQLQAW